MKAIATANKYPYLLWLTYQKEVEIEKRDMDLYAINEEGLERRLEKVHTVWIVLFKYVPFVFLLLLFRYPKTLEDLAITAVAFVIAFIGIKTHLRFESSGLKVFTVFYSILGAVLIFWLNLVETVHTLNVYVIEAVLITLIALDVAKRKYRQYYRLDLKHTATVHLAKRKKRYLHPFKKKWGFKTLFNISFSLPVSGYFIRIEGKE